MNQGYANLLAKFAKNEAPAPKQEAEPSGEEPLTSDVDWEPLDDTTPIPTPKASHDKQYEHEHPNPSSAYRTTENASVAAPQPQDEYPHTHPFVDGQSGVLIQGAHEHPKESTPSNLLADYMEESDHPRRSEIADIIRSHVGLGIPTLTSQGNTDIPEGHARIDVVRDDTGKPILDQNTGAPMFHTVFIHHPNGTITRYLKNNSLS